MPQQNGATGPSNFMTIGSRMVWSAHSIATDGGSSMPDRGWPNLVGAMARCIVTNTAKGGAVACQGEAAGCTGTGDGGYPSVLQKVVPLLTAAPYVPMQQLGVIDYGNNDQGYGHQLLAWKEAMRTIIARYMAASVKEDSDASVTLGGTWATTTTTTRNSGAGYQTVAASGGTVTIAVPADFPGGTVDVGWVVAFGNAQTVSYTVDATPTTPLGVLNPVVKTATISSGFGVGVNSGVVNAVPAGLAVGSWIQFTGGVTESFQVTSIAGTTIGINGNIANASHTGISFNDYVIKPNDATAPYNGLVHRFTGLAAGAHTIVATLAGTGSGLGFDYWAIEAQNDSGNAPLVFVASLFQAKAYTAYNTPLPVDADVTAWNNTLKGMLGTGNEFPTAQYIDTETLLPKTATYFAADNLHPNDRGHAMYAKSVFQQMSTSPILAAMSLQDIALQSMEERGTEHHNFTKYVGGAVTLNTASASAWTVVPGVSSLTIIARPGDTLKFGINAEFAGTEAVLAALDVATWVGGAIKNRVGGGTNGISAWQALSGLTSLIGPPVFYTVTLADLAPLPGGPLGVTLKLVYVTGTATNRLLQGNAGVPLWWSVENLGQPNTQGQGAIATI